MLAQTTSQALATDEATHGSSLKSRDMFIGGRFCYLTAVWTSGSDFGQACALLHHLQDKLFGHLYQYFSWLL